VSRLEKQFGKKVEFRQLNIDDPANNEAKHHYGFRAQPQVVILDRNGKVVLSRLSELTYEKLEIELETILAYNPAP
jgi:hypothetical protein